MLNVLSLAPGMKENFTLFICPFDLTICHNPAYSRQNYRNTLLPYKVFRLLFGVVFILYYLCIT